MIKICFSVNHPNWFVDWLGYRLTWRLVVNFVAARAFTPFLKRVIHLLERGPHICLLGSEFLFKCIVFNELLLISNNHARTAQSHPGNECFWVVNFKFLDHIASNQSPCSSEPSPTVNCNALPLKVWNYLHEFLYNWLGWTRSIRKLQIKNLYSVTFKGPWIIETLV